MLRLRGHLSLRLRLLPAGGHVRKPREKVVTCGRGRDAIVVYDGVYLHILQLCVCGVGGWDVCVCASLLFALIVTVCEEVANASNTSVWALCEVGGFLISPPHG